MSKTDGTPADQEVNKDLKSTEEPKKEETPAAEPTLQDLHKEQPKQTLPESIPYDRFKEKVDEVNTLKTQLEELTKQIDAKATTPAEVATDLEAIAKEHSLDSKVLGQIASALESRMEAKLEEKVRPITEAEARKNADAAFEKLYGNVIEANPDYKDIANKEVIKQLAFLQENSKLTLSQLLEKTYGGSVKAPIPTPTMEKETTPRGGPETIDTIDFKKAQEDSEYFQKIKADPALLRQYNDRMDQEVSRYI